MQYKIKDIHLFFFLYTSRMVDKDSCISLMSLFKIHSSVSSIVPFYSWNECSEGEYKEMFSFVLFLELEVISGYLQVPHKL